MLKKIEVQGEDTYGFEAIGKVTVDDYNDILIPLLDKSHTNGKQVRFLLFLGPQFEGYTPGAAWEDLKLAFHHVNTFERIALVSDVDWVKVAAHIFGSLVPCTVELYNNSSLNQAKSWLNSGEIGLDFALNEKTGVLSVELKEALSSLDFEILNKKANNWIKENGKLNALVIHTKIFPGWKDFGSFISHMTFVKNHQDKIEKVAFCADGNIPEIAPKIAHFFVQAQLQHFSYDRLNDALKWGSKKD